MVRINWTNKAISDLKNIYDYISLDSKYYAKREVLKIKLKTNTVKSHLKIGRKVPEVNDESIRELIEGRYRIVYKIISTLEIDILTIHHSSKNILELE